MQTLIFQSVVFLAYVIWITAKYGALTSISESYYHIREKGLFSLFCFVLGFPMFMYGRELYPQSALPGDYTWLFYLSMILCFTGAAADYKRTMTDIIHFVGTGISFTAAMLGLGLQYGIWTPAIIWVIVSIVCLPWYNRIFWIEIAAFASFGCGVLELNNIL